MVLQTTVLTPVTSKTLRSTYYRRALTSEQDAVDLKCKSKTTGKVELLSDEPSVNLLDWFTSHGEFPTVKVLIQTPTRCYGVKRTRASSC